MAIYAISITRLANPTNNAVVNKICQLEGVVVVGSGNFDLEKYSEKFQGGRKPK